MRTPGEHETFGDDAIQKAARQRYGSETDVRAEINPKTGEIKLQRLLKVVETIEHLFGYYGDDAGWSPEALRAIGVEPLPTPEPTA